MVIVTCLDLLLTCLSIPFFLYLLAITLAACNKGRALSQPGPAPDQRFRFAFVIPACNEEGLIAATVRSCLAVDYDPELVTVSVIADNCTDQTAWVARDTGAIVFERTDPVRRGKGYALEYLLGQCDAAPTRPDSDAVVVIDADTVVDRHVLNALSETLAGGSEWIQCYYTVQNPDSSWRTRLMTYAFSLFNGVWLLSQDRLGQGAALRGNGMCFATRALERFPWRAYGLNEDHEFSWMLRTAGERVAFQPEARVFAQMLTRGGPAAVAQRRRWEVGRSTLRKQFLGPLLRSRRIGLCRKVLHLIDLFFPPLVTLLLVLLAAASVHAGRLWNDELLRISNRLLPFHAVMGIVLVGYCMSPFFVLELPWRYLTSLLALPRYIVWKGFAALHAKPIEWVRTGREPTEAHART